MTPEPPKQPVDEARHRELIQKHVYGSPERRPLGQANWFRYASSASIGIEIAVAIVGCTLLAVWLENNYTHWSPWTTLLGFTVGIGASVNALVRTARQHRRDCEAREREEAAAGGPERVALPAEQSAEQSAEQLAEQDPP